MSKKLQGVFCFSLAVAAMMIGLAAIAAESGLMALAYIGVLICGAPLVSYSYCAKCSVRLHGCAHVFVGQMTRLVPARDQTDYAVRDLLGIALAFTAMLGFPQPWLWSHTFWLVVFWMLALASLAGNITLVCKKCGNVNCRLCPKYQLAKRG